MTVAALALTACPPQLDPHGTICNVDPDCATGLVCIANSCADPVVGGGGGGTATGGGSGGGGAAGGGGTGGGGGGGIVDGGPMDSGVHLVVMAVDAGAGDGGVCSSGDGTQTRRSDGTPAQCGDTPLCAGSDGGTFTAPWTPDLIAIAQVVGEPLPDLVALEQRTVHVLENLGGFAFVERASFDIGQFNATHVFTACLMDSQRNVMIAAAPMNQPMMGELLQCPVASATCSPVQIPFDSSHPVNPVTDAIAGDYINTGYDSLVVSLLHTCIELDPQLMPMGNDRILPVGLLGPMERLPDGILYYPASDTSVTTSVLPVNDEQASAGVTGTVLQLQFVTAANGRAGVALSLASPNGIGLMSITAANDLATAEYHLDGQVTRMVAGQFSVAQGLSRAAVIAAQNGEVDRYPVIASDAGVSLAMFQRIAPIRARELALGDLDGDGLDDLVIAADLTNELTILKGR